MSAHVAIRSAAHESSGGNLRAPNASARATTICVVGLRGFPNVMGGVEAHCEQIYRRLSKATKYRYIVLARDKYMSGPVALGDSLEVIPIWSLRNKYLEALPNAVAAVFHARFVCRAKLLHIHAIGPGLVTPLAKLLGMNVVVTHHGQDYRRAKWSWFAGSILRFGEIVSLYFADRVIVVSRSLAETLRRRHPRRAARICHIPNGAAPFEGEGSPPRDVAATLTRFGLKRGEYVLSVGRLVPEKGMHDLIEAFRRADAGLKLVIAGGADHEDAYARGLLMQAGPDIVFTGRLSHDALCALYANASLFVLASSHEGMPIAALEAIAANAPVLLSDIAANRDLELSSKHYYAVGNAAALSERLGGGRDELRVDRSVLLAKFDWDLIAQETQALYEVVLAKHRHARCNGR